MAKMNLLVLWKMYDLDSLTITAAFTMDNIWCSELTMGNGNGLERD